jgi:hypothetical protein
MLDRGGFPIRQISIVAQSPENENEVDDYADSRNVTTGDGCTDVWFGRLAGLLKGEAVIRIPGFGRVVAAGPLSAALLSCLDASGSATAIAAGGRVLGALASCGVSALFITKYGAHLKAGKYLMIAQGSADELARARNILESTEADEVNSHRIQSSGGRREPNERDPPQNLAIGE